MLIVDWNRREKRYNIRYMQFLKVGFPTMLLFVAISAVYLVIRYY